MHYDTERTTGFVTRWEMEQKFLTRPIITAYSWSVCAGEFGGRTRTPN